MGEFKGTKGPWSYTFGEYPDYEDEEDEENGEHFKLKGSCDEPIISGCGCCGSPWLSKNNYKEDARLIAASPELLEALLYQKRHQDGDASCDLQTFLHMRDAAINKALGEDNGN